jgi:long-chain acyl-CoA synthetase
LRPSENYPAGVPIHIKYPEIPVYYFLENTARKFPNRPGTYYFGKSLTYEEIWVMTRKFAFGLKNFGIKKGDKVGILLPNTPHFIISYNALSYIGATVVSINPLMTNQEIERELILTDCMALIVLDKLLDKVSGISVDLIIAEATYFTPIHLRSLSRLRSWNKDNHKDVIRFEELLNNPILNNRIQIDPKQDVAIIMFTSGTTGIPKGVMLTHFNQTTNALQAYHWLRGWGYSAKPQLKGWPVILCAIPFFHSYGLVVMNEAISFGCSLVLIPNPTAEAMIKAIDKHAVTHFPLIPRFVKEILKNADISKYNLSSLTTCASGGAHIEPNLMKEFEKITGARMYQGYGLTEAGPSVTATPIEGKPK